MVNVIRRRISGPPVEPTPVETPQRVQSATGRSAVSSAMKHRRTEHGAREQAQEETREFATMEELAKVRVTIGQTYNLGDFNFLRIDVEVTLPCTKDKVEETYQEVSASVAEKFQAEYDLWMK